MKIGIVCYPSLGGSGVVATELGHVLAARGHEVHFITYEVPFRLRIDDHNIFFHQVEINRYDLFAYSDYALPLAVKIASVSEEYGLDVLHVHYAIPHATSAYLAKQILGKSKPVVITTLHGTDITLVGRDPAYYQIVKYSIEHSDGVTAVSENLRQQTTEYFQIDKSIKVIHNFFIPRRDFLEKKPLRDRFLSDGQPCPLGQGNYLSGRGLDPSHPNFEKTPSLREGSPNASPRREDEKLLIHSSNFRSVKRSEDVVRIFTKVRKEVSCKLLFLGTGAGIEDVRQMVHDEKLDDEVFFLGENREIDPYVASSDLLLLPSSHESFGLVALEAMAYGVPVVASRVGGIPEVITNGETGYLASVGDVDQMATYAVELLTNKEKYDAMSHQGVLRAKEKFGASKILSQYISYYEEVLNC